MIENSSAGLAMLGGDVEVVVTHEEHHQRALARYPVAAGGQRVVAVELAWCTINAGKYRGQPAIEVRLDGQRVGELTYLMSQRYAPLVRQVHAHGGRPGCEARIQLGARGLEVVLRLPRETTGVLPLPQPAAPKLRARSKRPLWIAASVVGVILVGAAISNASNGRTPAANPPGSSITATTTVSQPTTTTTTTTATTATTQPTTTTTVPVEVPPPAPATPEVARTTTKTTPKAPPPPPTTPKPQPACDPNYTGCVPIASDVDCAGGSGDGPAYVQGPIRVIGRDIYRLDADHDGIACE